MLAEVQGMDLHARSPFMWRILRECLFPLLVPYSDIFQTFCVGQSLKCDVLKPRNKFLAESFLPISRCLPALCLFFSETLGT